LISKYLGLTIPSDADVSVSPHIESYGVVDFGIPEYALRYTYDKNGFVLKNLSNKQRRFKVDLSSLSAGAVHYRLSSKSGSAAAGTSSTVTLSPQEEAHWAPER
jgi:hypothetical protein